MTRRLIVRVEAEQELVQAFEWYEERRPGLGVELLDAIELALDAIEERPEAWSIWQRGYPYRKYVLRRFPFVIFFTAESASIQVVAFAHAKRQPGYWLGRSRR